MGFSIELISPNSTLQFRARYLYITLWLLCKVSIIVAGDEKIGPPGLQDQNQNKSQSEVNQLNGRAALSGSASVSTRSTPLMSSRPVCDNDTLNKCMAQLPPLQDMGIPSTPQGVEKACTKFNSGMDCVFDTAKKCLGKQGMEKLNSSMLGAHEMFTFLCRDAAFRQDFLQHSDCYRRISRHWDECSRNFILAIKSLNDHETSKDLCCVRIAFLQCLMDVTHRFCNDNAAKFIQLMGETLIRSTLRGHAPKQCSAVSHKDCPMLHPNSGSNLLLSPGNYFNRLTYLSSMFSTSTILGFQNRWYLFGV